MSQKFWVNNLELKSLWQKTKTSPRESQIPVIESKIFEGVELAVRKEEERFKDSLLNNFIMTIVHNGRKLYGLVIEI